MKLHIFYRKLLSTSIDSSKLEYGANKMTGLSNMAPCSMLKELLDNPSPGESTELGSYVPQNFQDKTLDKSWLFLMRIRRVQASWRPLTTLGAMALGKDSPLSYLRGGWRRPWSDQLRCSSHRYTWQYEGLMLRGAAGTAGTGLPFYSLSCILRSWSASGWFLEMLHPLRVRMTIDFTFRGYVFK